MFRRAGGTIEVLLAHPGGPFYRRQDLGAWTIPKGEAEENEELLPRAQVEFAEEIGFAPEEPFIPLGSVRQKGGKTVHAWAVEGDLPTDFTVGSNTFEMEWPPRSGRRQCFPEMDQAEFFPLETARAKLLSAQLPFLDRLVSALSEPS